MQVLPPSKITQLREQPLSQWEIILLEHRLLQQWNPKTVAAILSAKDKADFESINQFVTKFHTAAGESVAKKEIGDKLDTWLTLVANETFVLNKELLDALPRQSLAGWEEIIDKASKKNEETIRFLKEILALMRQDIKNAAIKKLLDEEGFEERVKLVGRFENQPCTLFLECSKVIG